MRARVRAVLGVVCMMMADVPCVLQRPAPGINRNRVLIMCTRLDERFARIHPPDLFG